MAAFNGGVTVSRYGGYQLLLAQALKFQTPRCELRYGADGKYPSMALFVDRPFAEQWQLFEENLVTTAGPLLHEKFADFDLRAFFRSSLRAADVGTRAGTFPPCTLNLSLPVYNGKCSAKLFDRDGAPVASHATVRGGDRVVVLLEVMGLWLKDQRAGTKCKVLEVKNYGPGSAPGRDVFASTEDSDEDLEPEPKPEPEPEPVRL